MKIRISRENRHHFSKMKNSRENRYQIIKKYAFGRRKRYEKL